MHILGINAYHGDSSACIFKDGQLIAASEEERFRRIKHWAGFPSQAIEFCLAEAGISIQQVNYIGISRDPKANFGRKVLTALKNKLSLGNMLDRVKNLKKASSIEDEIRKHFGLANEKLKARIIYVEHHRSHLASAFYASGYDESAIISIDGFGDFSSVMTATGRGTDISILQKVSYPHSLGIFYTAFTQYLGFPNYGDEYKVMGLAPYGKATYTERVREVIPLLKNGLFKLDLDYFSHPRNGVQMDWAGGHPHMDALFSAKMEETFGPARKAADTLTQEHKNLAASVQRVCEETVFHMLNHLQQETGLKSICLAGGVAQNSVANGKILLNTSFKNLYVPPAGHDAGTAIGAALWIYHQVAGQARIPAMQTAYYGSCYNNDEIEAIVKKNGLAYTRYEETELFDRVTDCLIGAGVVGWFQGRAEFGPRALGHRSILADPRREDAKEILNAKIKRRESFRPFAPSILKDHVAAYFEQDSPVPFMEKVFVIREEKRSVIPAVTHVDGTGRLQSVNRDDEPRYYGLIETFYKKTGIPILLNTSFNENEPIVNTPQEAIDCFLRTKMDMLVLGNILISR